MESVRSPGDRVRLLWTDTLAALLVEHDRVPPELVEAWMRRPSAYRLDDDADPLALARRLLGETAAPPLAETA
jgi:hypothetical protein